MDPKLVRSQIIDAYAKTIAKTIDAKTLNYLTMSVSKGENTIDSIIQTLMNTNDYHDRVKGMFQIVYFDTLGHNPTNEEFAEFWSVQTKTQPVDAHKIEIYIRSTDAFIKKYEPIIKELFLTYNPSIQCTDAIVAQFINKLCNTDNYNYDSLQTDVMSFKEDIEHKQPEQFNNSREIVVKPALDITSLETFEKVFERHMYVKEYFKYVVFPSPSEKQTIFASLDRVKEQQNSMFHKLAKIFSTYTNSVLTEHEFVNSHLLAIHSEEYYDAIIDNIVETNDYEVNMCRTIQEYYKKLFDGSLDDNDLKYIFNIIKKHKYDLYDNQLVDRLKEFKTETDTFIENIFTTYKRVLERQPDLIEVDEQLYKYRKGQQSGITIEDLNSQLVISLQSTLEFHDIIKKHIKSQYLTAYNSDIQPSKLYMLLDQYLKLGNDSISKLDATISEIISNHKQ